ncbi:hypothetical protein [Bradyrhizobium sp. CB2312]|uniref:hypothetical protein n=1 Tax=Bradyrhizobium sp. CB2312 TaxID=3039155 RepID=UPI0024B25D93|nr:hypothetical protein [Bradyrhizobium sp. CB2312]WFU68590.1 hypothetical protein QA642_25010 [Bradyrhizobium sp. CB2312]
MRAAVASCLLLAAGAVQAQEQPKGDVFPPVVKGIEYRLKYGKQPDQGWQDGMRFDFSREECLKRLGDPPMAMTVCMIRPETSEM